MELITHLFYMVWRYRVVRVGLIGGIGLLVQTLTFETLAFWLHVLHPSTAVIIGAELGIITNFFLNNRYSFNDRSHAPLWHRLVRFHLVVSGSLLTQWLCVFLTEQVTHNFWWLHLAFIVGVGLGFVSNYTGYRLWVWKHHEEPPV